MANYIDNALQKLLSLAIEAKTLWTNASPTSDFAPQTVKLSLSDYDAVIIEYIMVTTSSTDSVANTNFIYNRLCAIGKTVMLEVMAWVYSSTSRTQLANRRATVSTTSVYFSNCYQKDTYNVTTNTANNWAVPYKIIGIKLLGGGID